VPVTPKALDAHQKSSKEPDETKRLLHKIAEQQERILAALERLAGK